MGGQATTSGTTFQENVGAWLACQVLAGQARVAPLLDLGSALTIDDVNAETLAPIDDLKCRLSDGGSLYFQCKTTISVSEQEGSQFTSLWSQFTRQFLAGIGDNDRMVLAVESAAPATIREDLRDILNRLRWLSGGGRDEAIAAMPSSHRDLLESVHRVITACFLDERGVDAASSERDHLLSTAYVVVFDFGSDGFSIREAIETLKGTVLADAKFGEEAWNAILAFIRGLSPSRTGANRFILRRELQRLNYTVNPDAAFAEGIKVLRARTKRELRDISDHAVIPFGKEDIRIHRSILPQIAQDAFDGDLLVVGEAGAGKSGILSNLAATLDSDGADVVLLAVDNLETSSLGRLEEDLGLPDGQTLDDTLAAWTGEGRGYLIVDALDAARAAAGARTLQRLVRRVRNSAIRWRIVASIRAFDLEKSEGTQTLFKGKLSHAATHPSFKGLRVAHVQCLSDQELQQAEDAAPEIRETLSKSTRALRTLARSVFNLRLLAELIEFGRTPDQLSGVRSQIQLLDEYWNVRISGRPDGSEREQILRQITDRMVAQRKLTISDNCVTDARPMCELLASDNLLNLSAPIIPGGTGKVAYSHNLLFDFAVARLWVRDVPDGVIDEIGQPKGHELLLAIRPSLQIAFQRLWDASLDSFWETSLRWFMHNSMPPVGRMIVALVAAESFQTVSDTDPLRNAISGENAGAKEVMDWTIRAAIGKTRIDRNAFDLVGKGRPEWCRLARAIADADCGILYPLHNILAAVFFGDPNGRDLVTPEQSIDLAFVARHLVDTTIADEGLVDLTNLALEVCALTLDESCIANIERMRKVLEPQVVASRGYRFLPTIADHIVTIAQFDQQFVEQFLDAYADAEASADDAVTMGSGSVLTLVSNKRQDLSMVDYHLEEKYPELLNVLPVLAARVGIKIFDKHIESRERTSASLSAETFLFRGRVCSIEPDHSSIWDSTWDHAQHDLWWTTAEALFGYLEVAEDTVLDTILDTFASNNAFAFVWRRLLRAGAKTPDRLGERLFDLVLAPVILASVDTCTDAGNFLTASFPSYSIERRAAIEQVIFDLPIVGDQDQVDRLVRRRNVLVGCLPADSIVTDPIRSIMQTLQGEGGVPANTPLIESSAMRWISEEEHERSSGIDLDATENARFRKLRESVKDFCRDGNRKPSLEEIRYFAPTLDAFGAALGAAAQDGVDKRLLEHGEEYVIGCYEVFSRCNLLTDDVNLYQQTRTRLIAACAHPNPIPNEIDDAAWDSELGHWGSPSARVDAAQGVIHLIAHATKVDVELLDRAEQLFGDPAPQVRFQILRGFHAVWKHDRERTWRMCAMMAHNEERLGLLNAFVGGWLLRFGRHERDRVRPLIDKINERMLKRERGDRVLKATIVFYLRVWLYDREEEAFSQLRRAISEPIKHQDELSKLIQCWGEIIADDDGPENGDPEWFYEQATSELTKIFQTCMGEFNAIASAEDGSRDELKQLAHHVDLVIDMVWRGLGIAREDFKRVSRDDEIPRIRRYMERCHTLFEVTVTVSFAPAAYELLGLFYFMVPADPKQNLLWAKRLIDSAKAGRFHMDTLAAERAVAFIELYLADFKEIFRDDSESQHALMSILDVFVEQGWPSAQPLIVRLDEVYRG